MGMKRVAAILLIIFMLMVMTGCMSTNRNGAADLVWNFNYAYVGMNGMRVAEGPIQTWRDFDDSDVVQVQIDGVYYLTHYTNVILVKK